MRPGRFCWGAGLIRVGSQPLETGDSCPLLGGRHRGDRARRRPFIEVIISARRSCAHRNGWRLLPLPRGPVGQRVMDNPLQTPKDIESLKAAQTSWKHKTDCVPIQ
ncbi:hypothetical protein EYF80_026398 [Liparis tanakae]|uniref:Uncharacterized protein n=1 Tax=Liparis tanakae TaxID=230148 RepID=A0A4Z2HCA2_9TELE|nr:hypothetical protein EYF80_026398 [Liparis tanakae]